MYLLIPLQSSLSYCARDSGAKADRGKSHPLIGWDTNAQASFLLHFYSMAIKRSVPFEKIIF